MKTLLVWQDLGYGVRHWPSEISPELVLEFEVVSIFGENFTTNTIEWVAGDGSPVPDPDAAAIYLHGSLKWDGCSNMHFDEQERCMLHFCGRRYVEALGALLSRIYDVLGPTIPKWSP